MDSIFTKIINGQLPSFQLWESDLFIAILVPDPINSGHTLLIPKQQIDYIFDLSDELYNSMWQVVKWLAPSIQKAMECKRIGIAVEGFGVPHVHVHLVPVNSGNELNPERAVSASHEQLITVQNKICQVIKDSVICGE
jgi:histidine triad (HIT) family protein